MDVLKIAVFAWPNSAPDLNNRTKSAGWQDFDIIAEQQAEGLFRVVQDRLKVMDDGCDFRTDAALTCGVSRAINLIADQRKMDFPTKVRANMYESDAAKISHQFRTDALAWLQEQGVPENLTSKVYQKAWSDGHSGGYTEVLNEMYDLIEIFRG